MAVKSSVIKKKNSKLVLNAAMRYEKLIDKQLTKMNRKVRFYESLDDYNDENSLRKGYTETPSWNDIAVVLKEKYNAAGWDVQYTKEFCTERNCIGQYHCFTFEMRV